MSNNKFYTGSICLTDIPKELISTGNNGKKYLNIAIFANKDGANQWGNTHYISCAPKQDERKEGVNYFIGNLKERGSESNNPVDNINAPKGEETAPQQAGGSDDDFPF